MFLHQIEILKDRQGQGSRTILASPLVAAATAVAGKIVDVTEHIETSRISIAWKNLQH